MNGPAASHHALPWVFFKVCTKMRCLYLMYVALALVRSSSGIRPIDDHIDSGKCLGEFQAGNSPFVPNRYSLYVDLNPEMKNFRGDVNIFGTLNENTDSIVLHSVNLNVSSVRVNGLDLDNTTWFLDDIEGTLSITLPEDVLYSNLDNLIVGVSYEGIFNDTAGIIMQNYDKTDPNRWIIFTHLEPIAARTVFPCIDLPKYKARFDISLKNPGKRRTVLSNMPRKSSDSRVIKFQTTPLMSTYLVSFVVCDYVPVKANHRNYKTREITTWIPREMRGKFGANFVSSLVPQLLEALEEYTGNAYSLPKLDMYVVMDKPGIGGMENWGLIMYEADSFMQSKRASANDLTKVIFTVAHELAHHWFGNSVTVADWCGMWFQEAIPTFLHGHIPDKYSYDLDMVNKVKWTARKEVMDSECFLYDYAVPLRDVENPRADEALLFNMGSYFKGASLLYMIESMVTPEVFKNSLRSFISTYNNTYTTEHQLWSVVEKQVGDGGVSGKLNAPASLSEIAETWVTNKSHPIVILNRNKNGSLSVKQRICSQEFKDGKWLIPISYTTSSNANFGNTKPQKWITPATHDFQPLGVTLHDNEWIILNIMGTGFYRVDYDKITWKLLIQQLKKDTAGHVQQAIIPPIHRAMLVDDSFHTANTGEGLTKAFEIMEYVKHETSTYVWEALATNVGYYYAVFPEKERALFKKYVHFLLTDAFARAANTEQWERAYNIEMESVNERSLREPVFDLSYSMELPAVYNFSRDVALKVIYEKMEEKIIPSEVKTKLWCAAASTGDVEVFEHLMIAYDSEKDEKKRAQIFQRLQCSKGHTKLLLDLILQSNVKGSKATLRKNVKDFLIDHWPAECEEILSFIEENKMLIVDNESQMGSEFQGYVKSPRSECKDKTKELFHTNSIDDVEDDDKKWKETYGTEPLKWLTEHEKQWS